MSSIRITQFGGLLPKVDAQNRPAAFASVAHNCLLKDGSLRAQAEWVKVGEQAWDGSADNSVQGMAYDIDAHAPGLYKLKNPVSVNGAPFAQRLTVGVNELAVDDSTSYVALGYFTVYSDSPIPYIPFFVVSDAAASEIAVGDILICSAPAGSAMASADGHSFQIVSKYISYPFVGVLITPENEAVLPDNLFLQEQLAGLTLTKAGAASGMGIAYCTTGVFEEPTLVGLPVPAWGHTIGTVPQFKSKKMTPRNYGITLVRKLFGVTEESPMFALTQDGNTTINCYEGDVVGITAFLPSPYTSEYFLRIYRTFTGLDTGVALNNALDTTWHMVLETPLVDRITIQYYDGNITNLPFDANYSQGFHPHAISPSFFAMTEGGWFIAANEVGQVQVSERYLPHAWPPENYFFFTDAPVGSLSPVGSGTVAVSGMAVSRDTAFFGTNNYPYIFSIAEGAAGMQGAIKPFKEYAPCNTLSITATPSGAVYAGVRGVYAISREGIKNLSTPLSNPDDTLYQIVIVPETNQKRTVSFGNTVFGAYHKGWYYGFCDRGQ